MPSGHPLLARLLVAAIVVLGACGPVDDVQDEAAPADDDRGATGTPGDPTAEPVEGPAESADARLVTPSGGRVQEAIDRDGSHTTVFIGDSVMVSIADDLATRVDGDLLFDAANCRRLAETVRGSCGGTTSGSGVIDGLTTIEETVDELTAAHVVPDVVVLILANNSTIEDYQIDAAMELLSDVPEVWWVNARIEGYGRQDFNNTTLAELDDRSDQVGVIDWYSASDDPALFRDNVHPNDRGQAVLAELIADHLDGSVP